MPNLKYRTILVWYPGIINACIYKVFKIWKVLKLKSLKVDDQPSAQYY